MIEEEKANTNNPWCNACREEHCCIDPEGTCTMIRIYLSAVKIYDESPPKEMK